MAGVDENRLMTDNRLRPDVGIFVVHIRTIVVLFTRYCSYRQAWMQYQVRDQSMICDGSLTIKL